MVVGLATTRCEIRRSAQRTDFDAVPGTLGTHSGYLRAQDGIETMAKLKIDDTLNRDVSYLIRVHTPVFNRFLCKGALYQINVIGGRPKAGAGYHQKVPRIDKGRGS